MGFLYITILPTFGLDQLMNIIEGAVFGGAELAQMNCQLADKLEDNFSLVTCD